MEPSPSPPIFPASRQLVPEHRAHENYGTFSTELRKTYDCAGLKSPARQESQPGQPSRPHFPSDALPSPRQDLPALPTALIEQLGLRLESARGAIPILVIERAQQPMVDAYSTTADPN